MFRRLFSGKVMPNAEHPESLLYFYLTSPRRAAPRWYQEGIAVFLDTWMAGGIGRAQGPYDEMVFRSMTLDGSRFFDPLGLASELHEDRLPARVELVPLRRAVHELSRLPVLARGDHPLGRRARTARRPTTRHSSSAVFGTSLDDAWQDWIALRAGVPAAEHRRDPQVPHDGLHRRVAAARSGRCRAPSYDPETQDALRRPELPGDARVRRRDLAEGRLDPRAPRHQGRRASTPSRRSRSIPHAKTLFFTTDNTALSRPDARSTRRPAANGCSSEDARIGDLAFDKADASLWGIRTFNGICTLVRIPPPYNEWKQVYTWPYGEVAYDLDVSPDGTTARRRRSARSTASRRCACSRSTALLAGDVTPLATFELRHRGAVELHLLARRQVPVRQLVLHRRVEHLPLRSRDRGDGGA